MTACGMVPVSRLHSMVKLRERSHKCLYSGDQFLAYRPQHENPSPKKNGSSMSILNYTLPETNIAPELDGWKMSFLMGRPIFRGYVSFRKGT